MSLIDDILNLADIPTGDLPPAALEKARLSLIDWIVCGWAGKDEPLAGKLRALAAYEAGAETSTLIGGGKAPARMAALVNGATSHALDFDDTHFAHVGHLSVGVYPAALAVGEEIGTQAKAVVEAFLVGAEAAVRIGSVLGAEHYDRGFHQTATAGAFGATVAATRLYGLDRGQTRAALGLCATRASGLKSQFGTMGKPYNAGIAASNGVECAALAKMDFTSVEDGLMNHQGFISTHTGRVDHKAVILVPARDRFLFEDNKYKFHACCHGTHAMIEGLLSTDLAGKGLGNIVAVTLRTSPRWLKVCDKKAPQTGLEVKFSYVWLAGMVLRGDHTGSDRIYTDTLAGDGELSAFAKRVTICGDPSVGDLQAGGEVTLANGQVVPFTYDLEAPLDNTVLYEKLKTKAESAVGEKGRLILSRLHGLDGLRASDLGALLASEGA